ncbi:MAG: copper homeostasis protein CutC [Lachnospiraceae bacterium]|jgi:copper homeostasis protein|nr:copper homeostasis protein CutC [Lachnospiraceae bacterium]
METISGNPHQKYILECCVDSVESALQAEKGGADRLELCSNLIIGGTTPTLALFRQIREHTNIRIHVLIRPRFGDFLYTKQELHIIAKEIDMFRKAGAEGIVIGCLTPDGSLDCEAMHFLIDYAGQMTVTLHRAFDMSKDPFQTLELAKELGIHTILTSGCQASCLDGIDLLRQLDEKSNGEITLMAGAGIQESSVRILREKTNLTAFHMSGKSVKNSKMQFRNPNVFMGLPGMSEYEIWETDSNAVSAVRKLLS